MSLWLSMEKKKVNLQSLVVQHKYGISMYILIRHVVKKYLDMSIFFCFVFKVLFGNWNC